MKLYFAGFLVFIGLLVGGAYLLVVNPLWQTPPLGRLTEVSPQKLKTRVLELSQRNRDFSNEISLQTLAREIEQEWKSLGLQTELQPFVVDGRTYYNVIGQRPQEMSSQKPVVVVGAHYDTFEKLPGADDNASGVAGLMELVQSLQTEAELPFNIHFVAFCLEEPPYFRSENMGSFQYANFLHQRSIPVHLMISLEMIGYFSDDVGSQQFPFRILSAVYPTTGNFIAIVSNFENWFVTRDLKDRMRQARIPVHSINAPSFVSGVDWSDHLNFWRFGYPAVMITDTSLHRNPQYHTALDLPESLNYEKMALVIEALRQYLLATPAAP